MQPLKKTEGHVVIWKSSLCTSTTHCSAPAPAPCARGICGSSSHAQGMAPAAAAGAVGGAAAAPAAASAYCWCASSARLGRAPPRRRRPRPPRAPHAPCKCAPPPRSPTPALPPSPRPGPRAARGAAPPPASVHAAPPRGDTRGNARTNPEQRALRAKGDGRSGWVARAQRGASLIEGAPHTRAPTQYPATATRNRTVRWRASRS